MVDTDMMPMKISSRVDFFVEGRGDGARRSADWEKLGTVHRGSARLTLV
jgi:hypothetical protein